MCGTGPTVNDGALSHTTMEAEKVNLRSKCQDVNNRVFAAAWANMPPDGGFGMARLSKCQV